MERGNVMEQYQFSVLGGAVCIIIYVRVFVHVRKVLWEMDALLVDNLVIVIYVCLSGEILIRIICMDQIISLGLVIHYRKSCFTTMLPMDHDTSVVEQSIECYREIVERQGFGLAA